MKAIKYAVAALTLSVFSFAAGAAEQVSPAQAQGLNKIGVVSAQGASTLDELNATLAAKAEAAGAKAYSITSANTNNLASGTAVIYN
ncbi:DUF1471 family protein YbiJ [Cronobacter muytjensii]|uniref:DUF1471 domain-containing protein n=1 Tax=Cronobacter muytjensii TaxID=413501 RepID=A0A2T7AZL4_9ENTR|nr:DUF1471 family protein YbiJ [Cronobacter muytjensii]ELY6343191.1 DUF1471 domain-containing protein [Cronobacter muytjensii]KAB0883951.1 DUF1471 domain-containing protein [Cronobacter muytjensii]MBF4812095.1 DUF1471 domain-containing protein [Cronobacter muytjensii]PUX18163.1 DUF1471 domain-containing protein [Cronobacter muytjensii]